MKTLNSLLNYYLIVLLNFHQLRSQSLPFFEVMQGYDSA